MARVHNFNAGPSALPLSVLERARDELVELGDTGMSIMEHSHRGKAYDAIHNQAIELVRELMGVPDTYDVLFLQGGASQQFAAIPMNLLGPGQSGPGQSGPGQSGPGQSGPGQSADYVITGTWSQKALKEARIIGQARVAATTEREGKFRSVPKSAEYDFDLNAAYVHFTSNNTIAGTQFPRLPDTGGVPSVVDMSSDILSRRVDVSKFGAIYAGAQKNLGPSGVTLVVIRKDLVESGAENIPTILQYRTHASSNSLYNTAPTFSIYMLRNVLEWVKGEGGVEAIERRNDEKAARLYGVLEERSDLFHCPVERESRSKMNVVWNLPTPEEEAECVAAATRAGLVGLKGHRSVGGLRASLYNAVSTESVDALCEFLRSYDK